ncbi:bZIP transcription factor 53-like [Prosopis cineraria]|uniref:bZIP transcription factor 53-like n=1 Tax=Prosopis cineraria TaxID=364024 RepID=UPI002410ADC8|nr:bZIP transcription factor 53-like [Prosopis cineraria]
MVSTLPASDPFLNNPFWALEGSFPAPWEDLGSVPGLCPDILITSPVKPAGKFQPHALSDDEKRVVPSILEERKRRRMISNRESARRSRMRKQKHLENLRLQVNRFRIQNRELNSRLQFLLHHYNRVSTENEWLRSEQTRLRQKLHSITQILALQPFASSAWPCNSTTIFTTE